MVGDAVDVIPAACGKAGACFHTMPHKGPAWKGALAVHGHGMGILYYMQQSLLLAVQELLEGRGTVGCRLWQKGHMQLGQNCC